MTNDTCPICGEPLVEIRWSSRPDVIQYGCMKCHWESEAHGYDPENKPYMTTTETLACELSEYFNIPCCLCNKYFDKEGNCPTEIEQCSSRKHWWMLLERMRK